MLTVLVFLPLLGAIFLALVVRGVRPLKHTAAIFTFATFLLSVAVFLRFDPTQPGLQFQERAPWIPAINAQYLLGVDGLSLPLVVLTTLLGFLSVLASWNIPYRHREYFFWLLVLETGVLGVFVSLDFLLFFLFWEVELIPMYMLIGTWGSPPPLGRREYSAIKFLIYTILGSAFMLVGILALFFTTGTFDMLEIARLHLREAVLPLPMIYLLLFLAYAIKLPIFPFHTWLPDAHTDAPTAVSVILAGVLLKMGGYALIRVNVGMFPEVSRDYAGLLAALAVTNILYGAAVTLVQRDLKRLIAYSSISHMGFVLLGIAALTPVGLTGATLQMFTHGTITGLLFLLAGLVYDKTHTRHLPGLGGLAHGMPFIAVVFVIAGLASLGLPSMSGFVAELLIFLGTYPVWPLATLLGAFGIVLGAGYILWTLQRALFGPQKAQHDRLADATPLEAVPLVSLVVAIMLVGLYPRLLTDVIWVAVQRLLS